MVSRIEYPHETARITVNLDPQIETTLDNGRPVLARRLFINAVNTIDGWKTKDRVQASVTIRKSRTPDEWLEVYYTQPVTITPALQEIIDHAVSLLS